MYFKVLKSGFKVEDCRLGNADRLIKYLTVMSVVAWRLFTITLMARTNPDTSCTEFLTENEWKRLTDLVDGWELADQDANVFLQQLFDDDVLPSQDNWQKG